MKTKKVPNKISMLRHKNEGLYISFLGVFFPTHPLLIPHFYDVIEGLSTSLPIEDGIHQEIIFWCNSEPNFDDEVFD